jgi:hypothetical protein
VRWLAIALVVSACGGPTKSIHQARYDAELSVLLAETAEVVRRWYPTIEVDPRGTIRTPWQRVARSVRYDWLYATATNAEREADRTKYFVRFHVAISSTRPARIEVTGHAAKLVEGTTTPTELRPEEEPRWTSDLAAKLRSKIHARLERFAR